MWSMFKYLGFIFLITAWSHAETADVQMKDGVIHKAASIKMGIDGVIIKGEGKVAYKMLRCLSFNREGEVKVKKSEVVIKFVPRFIKNLEADNLQCASVELVEGGLSVKSTILGNIKLNVDLVASVKSQNGLKGELAKKVSEVNTSELKTEIRMSNNDVRVVLVDGTAFIAQPKKFKENHMVVKHQALRGEILIHYKFLKSLDFAPYAPVEKK